MINRWYPIENTNMESIITSYEQLMQLSPTPGNILEYARKSNSALYAVVYCCEAMEKAMMIALEDYGYYLPDKQKTGSHNFFTELADLLVRKKIIDLSIQTRILEIRSLCDIARNPEVYNRWASDTYREELARIFENKDSIIRQTELIIDALLS